MEHPSREGGHIHTASAVVERGVESVWANVRLGGWDQVPLVLQRIIPPSICTDLALAPGICMISRAAILSIFF